MSERLTSDALSPEVVQAALHRARILRARAFKDWLDGKPAPAKLPQDLCTASRS